MFLDVNALGTPYDITVITIFGPLGTARCNIERFLVVGEGGIGATLKRTGTERAIDSSIMRYLDALR